MPRRGNIIKRDVLPDPVYNSKLVTKLVNRIMLDGKKGTAQKILYNAFAIVELKVRRVGGQNYQVPVEVSKERKITLGLRWLVSYSRNRGEKTMEQKLAAEIIDAANGTGASVKKRDDTHRMAEANKAFAHFRW